jgi:hypothetical protein
MGALGIIVLLKLPRGAAARPAPRIGRRFWLFKKLAALQQDERAVQLRFADNALQ